MAALVTLRQAKDHLRIDADGQDNDIMLKVLQASAIVQTYLKAQGDPTWTDLTAPGNVQAAVLLMLGHLYEHRGDNLAPDGAVWDAVGRLLVGLRDPALA